jgi:hypothetical protein
MASEATITSGFTHLHYAPANAGLATVLTIKWASTGRKIAFDLVQNGP